MFVSASVNVTLLSVEPFGLVSVKTIALVAPASIEPGTKFFVSVGGESTTSLAVFDAAPAVGVCVAVTPLVVLCHVPETFDVIVTVTVQLAPAPSVGTVRLSAVAPTTRAGALVMPAQVPPIVVLATDMLDRASVKLRFLSAIVLPLVSVNVITLVPPCAIGLVPKAFAIVGALATLSVAVLEPVPAAPVCVVATPDAVLL